MDNLKIEEIDGGVVLPVKVVPGSSKTSISGILGGMLKVKVSAPPEKGKANQCIIEYLAKQLSAKKKAINIISGSTNPVKQVQIMGISAQNVLEKLGID
jgi:uncharacterized protein (TIGR00251 family)